MKKTTQTTADKSPLARINHVLETECRSKIYIATLVEAAQYLREVGIKPASLMDAKTGYLTNVGRGIIAAAVKCAWEQQLNVASNYDISERSFDALTSILSHPDLLDFLMAQAVEKEEKERL